MKKRDDIDFSEFEKILKDKLVQIEGNIEQLRSELESVGSDDGINDMEDLASLHSLSEKDNTILHQQEHELKETMHALGKINNGTFGICEKSAKPIPVERLRVNPIARTKVGLED
ncbi:TraR/DksA family transcriptional regulator [Sulfurovum sp.]|uniref:TraR/DksA family transcriptional regulator n=1 Tax=Sulfurovum sp. TaxID=1969726 RepID=UPI0035625A86